MKETFMLPHLGKFRAMNEWPNAPVSTTAQVNDFIPWLCKTPCDYLLRDDPVGMAECTLLVHEYTGVDSLSANLDIYNLEAEAIGAPINYYTDHMPDLDRGRYFIKDEADLDKIKWPGLQSGRFPYLLEYVKAYMEYVGIPAPLGFCGPWSLASNLYGLDNLVIDSVESPDFVHEMLRRIVEDLHAPMFRDLLEAFPFLNRIPFADAFASPPMVSMPIIREFIEPALALEAEALGMDGVTFADSGIWGVTQVPEQDREEFIDFVARSSGLGVIAFDPDAFQLGVRYYRDYADARKVPLMIGLSTSFLQTATQEQVVERMKDYVLTGKDGITPFMFFYSNIAPGTPIENIAAAQAVIDTYGAPGAGEDSLLAIPEKEPFEQFLKNKMENNTEGYTFRWLEKSEYRNLL